MAKTILVTGGAGFIGSNLIKRLISDGDRVICVDNLYSGRKENIAEFQNNPNFQFVEHDICQPLQITDHVDQIYHLACPASPPAYQKDPIFTWKTSVFGAYNILEFAQKNNSTILFTSTSEVYGDPLEHPQKESYKGNVNTVGIRSCYDEGKRAAESLFFDYHRKYNLPVRVIRIFNTYGPNMDPQDGRVVSNFINQALKNEDITIYGNGSQTRSFQYIDDLIEGIYRMMNNSIGFTGPVNIGNPDEFTIREFADIVLKNIHESSSKIIYKPFPEDDPRQRRPDISLAKEKLDWEPKVDLKTGLIKTIEYFRKDIKANQTTYESSR